MHSRDDCYVGVCTVVPTSIRNLGRFISGSFGRRYIDCIPQPSHLFKSNPVQMTALKAKRIEYLVLNFKQSFIKNRNNNYDLLFL